MPDFNEFRMHGPARKVAGGIKAQTKRGASFGKSWWGRKWIEILESFNIGSRLNRGKAYARKGQVIDLEITEGKVTALVQGSRKTPYKVSIQMQVIALEAWQDLARTSFNQALIAAQLLSGVMPQNAENLFEERKLNLFPLRVADLETDCSCPDYSNPCKHIAAVHLLLGEEFDREPFLIFKLRGMSRVKLLKLIFSALEQDDKLTNAIKPRKKAEYTKNLQSDNVADLQYSKPDAVEFLPASSADYWKDVVIDPDSVPAAKTPRETAALLKTIGSPPFWRAEENFIDAMTSVYVNASEYASSFLIAEEFE